MALNPSAAYPGQIDTTSDPAGYPFGAAQNDAVIGDGLGTPLERGWVKDLFGFLQALLVQAGLTPSGTPDKVGASQYLTALTTLGDVRSKLALYKSQAVNWPERASFSDSGGSSPPGIGWAPDLGVNGGGLWVLQSGSSNGVYTSEDGELWTNRGFLGSASFTNPCISYGKINGSSGFLLSQNSNPGVYYTSTDGVTWNSITTAAVPANPVSAWNGSLWVMAGNAGVIYTSPTGLANTWTARTTPAGWIAGCGGARKIVWNGALFVIIPLASYGKFLTSPDGITWTERTTVSGIWHGLAYSSYDGLWLASSDGTGLVASVDGLTWFLQNTAQPSNDLAVNGPAWVMATTNALGGGVMYSVDKGATWQKVAVGNHRTITAGWGRVLMGDGRFMVAHGDASKIEMAMSARVA